MKTNLDIIQEVIEYIDAHLEERLDLGHCLNAVHRLLGKRDNSILSNLNILLMG